MLNLQPVDFKAVAAKGAYVYCYLRSNGTPYYIGIGTTAYRPFQKNHNCPVPSASKDRWRVRLMRSGLSWEMACEWEKRYIAQFGRKGLGGILWNRTDGGDGRLGYVVSDEEKQVQSAAMRVFHLKQIANGQINSFGVDGETWLDMPKDKRIALTSFCSAHPEVSGVDYLSGNYTKWQYTAKGLAHQKAAAAKNKAASEAASAAKYGIALDVYKGMNKAQKGSIKSWLERHPEKTAADYFATDVKAERSAASVLSKQKVAAAKHGLTLQQWQALSIFQRDTCRKDQAKAAFLGVSYFDFLSMTKGQKISAAKQAKRVLAAA